MREISWEIVRAFDQVGIPGRMLDGLLNSQFAKHVGILAYYRAYMRQEVVFDAITEVYRANSSYLPKFAYSGCKMHKYRVAERD